jgi:D-methionine transport system substrate-binding protein
MLTGMGRHWARVVGGILGAALGLAAPSCTAGDAADDHESPSAQVLTVGVTPQRDAQILGHVKDALAPAIGFNMRVVEFSDASVTTLALRDRRVDVAFVRNNPEALAAGSGSASDPGLVFVAPVYIEPYGIYSATATTVTVLTKGGRILIPADPAGEARALQLLADKNVVQLRVGAGMGASLRDITANPHHVRIDAVTPAQMALGYRSVAAVVVDAATARQAGLPDDRRTLALESADGSPFAEGLVVRAGDEQDPEVKKLAELLRSPNVKSYIERTYHRTLVPAE